MSNNTVHAKFELRACSFERGTLVFSDAGRGTVNQPSGKDRDPTTDPRHRPVAEPCGASRTLRTLQSTNHPEARFRVLPLDGNLELRPI